MSLTLAQIFALNPITTNANTDLMYFSQSPYTPGHDAGMTFANFAAQFVRSTSILDVPHGGTGNTSFTAFSVITAGITSTSPFQNVLGLGTTGQVLTSQGAGLLPVWAAIGTGGGVTSLAAGTGITLTPNPIITVGSIALTVPVTEILGGTNQTTYTLGDILYSSAANTLAKLAGNITTVKQYLSQTGTGAVSAAPAWATISGTDITGAALTKTDDTNVTLTLGGTPATSLLRATSLTLGWTGQLAVPRGGTGNLTFTAFSVICAGTTATGAFQNVSGLGSSGNVLTSQGAGALPQWAAPSAATTTVITDDNTTNATMFPVWVTANSGSLPLKVSSTELKWNPSTKVYTITGSIAGLTGTISQPSAITDSSGNNILTFSYIGSAVNNLNVGNATLGSHPSLSAGGTGLSININLQSKNGNIGIVDATFTNSCGVLFYNAAATFFTGLKVDNLQATNLTLILPAVDGITNQPIVTNGSGVLSFGSSLAGITGTIRSPSAIQSSAGANVLGFGYTASAVNFISVNNAATGNFPSIVSGGSDANVDLFLGTKSGNFRFIDSLNTVAPIVKIFNAASTHFTGLQVASAQATDVTFTLPAAVPSVSGAALVSTTGGVLSFSSTPVSTVPQITVLTSGSGTYTTPSGCLYLNVELVGGGAGGGNSGTSGNAAGTAGHVTTFGSSFLTANGGSAGATPAQGGIGGTATGGDVNITGGAGGGGGENIVSGSVFFSGGTGGSSYFGGAGASGPIGGGAAGGTAAANSGSGGGGAGTGNVAATIGGGGGGSGGYCRKIVTSPSATYAYVVGATANGATAGTGGSGGGAGAAGIIIVTAYFQ